MMKLNPSVRVMLGCVALLAVGCLCAQDWPQWRGPNRDGKLTSFAAPETWPQQLSQKWKVTIGAGDTTPALVGDRLYAFGRQEFDEVITCLDVTSGKVVWENKYPANFVVTGPPARHPGPRSSPVVADGKVCTLGVGGILSCLNAATGDLVWRKQSTNDFLDAAYRFDTAMSPIVVDGRCIVHIGGKGAGAVIVFDLKSGAPKWKWDGDAPGFCSPVAMTVGGTKAVAVLTAKALIGLDVSDGRLLWQSPFSAGQGNNVTPVIDGQTVFLSGQGKGLAAIRIEKQDGAFAISNLWSNSELGARFATPILKDGLLYGYARNFFCADARTGETRWTATGNEGQTANFLDAGSVILVLTGKSELIAFKPGEKEYRELARIKVGSGETWAHPVVAGKRIFVRDSDSVTLWTLE